MSRPLLICLTALWALVAISDLAFAASEAPSSEPSTDAPMFGDLFIEQERLEPKRYRLDLQYGTDISNAYYSTSRVRVGAAYWLSKYIAVSPSISFYSSSEKPLAQAADQELLAQGITAIVDRPELDYFLSAKVRPIQGLVKLFGSKPTSYYLNVDLGVGQSQFVNTDSNLLAIRIAAEPELFFSENFSAFFGVDSTWDQYPENGFTQRSTLYFGVSASL